MFSFDVVSLFTNVPLAETIDIIIMTKTMSRKMKANDRLNSVAKRFDTFTSVIFNCNNQNTARCKANNNLMKLNNDNKKY